MAAALDTSSLRFGLVGDELVARAISLETRLRKLLEAGSDEAGAWVVDGLVHRESEGVVPVRPASSFDFPLSLPRAEDVTDRERAEREVQLGHGGAGADTSETRRAHSRWFDRDE
mmetsp:Transcript_53271/g.88448  ORF Transcript_53271/g.88448 Transcript_53271/m.88448 type:complete len:115 (+) Transcript_53271:678-1022(+)